MSTPHLRGLDLVRAAGHRLALDSWAFLAAAVVLGIGVRPGAAREERDLEREFGDDWRRYRSSTPMLVLRPRVAGSRGIRLLKWLGILVSLDVLAEAGYFLVSRLIVAALGTTRAERRASMPGDELAVHRPRRRHAAAARDALGLRRRAERTWSAERREAQQ